MTFQSINCEMENKKMVPFDPHSLAACRTHESEVDHNELPNKEPKKFVTVQV